MRAPPANPRALFIVPVILLVCAGAKAADCPWQPDSAGAKGERIEYGAPFPNLRSRVVWGRSAPGPNGTGLAFGGQDQASDDGIDHTCLRENGRWIAIADELRAANPMRELHDRIRAAAKRQQEVAARLRYIYFQGAPAANQAAAIAADVAPAEETLARGLAEIEAGLRRAPPGVSRYQADQARIAGERIAAALAEARGVRFPTGTPTSADAIRRLHKLIVDIDRAADPLGAEPPPRAVSPIAFDAKTGLYVLFGGDHFDYLMNDTWVFDPRQRRWFERHPSAAPAPRANHALVARGDGTVEMHGGLFYSSATDYLASQYAAASDGTWIYDIAADAWHGDRPTGPDQRAYRTGRFDPDAFLAGPRPDAAEGEARLAALPANTWVALKPNPLPVLNRDWGTSVLDPDLDVILRWSGGHKAHSGSDVLHYHPATNRWELPYPIEFPLGVTFSWETPYGVNFNRRPWMSFHGYRTYAYDAAAKSLIWMGRTTEFFLYDPRRAAWSPKFDRPKGMAGFWQDMVEATPTGTFLLDIAGQLWRYDAAQGAWAVVKLAGVKLPGAAGDRSAMTYDPLRHRLVIAHGEDNRPYDGQLYAVDLATLNVTRLNPQFMAGAANFSFIALMRHDPRHDVMLVGATAAPDGPGRMPAYDPAGNRWVSLKIGGDNPYTDKNRLVSLGLIYDAKRDLYWTADAASRVYALRLDPKTADLRPLGTQ